MYAINRTTTTRVGEQTEVEHIFTEDSATVYQLFLWTQEALRGKEFPKTKKRAKGRRKASPRV